MLRSTRYTVMTLLVLASQIPLARAEGGASAPASPVLQTRWNQSRNAGAFGYAGRLEKTVGLTPEQRDAVRGLLADQRQKTQAVRETTDEKIRALLNAEQVKKFDAMKAQEKERRAQRGK